MPETNPVARRRTFAIISHPDAGKTTLTEKILLFGGAIQLAGEVRAKANRRPTRSDWMGIERERGISVVTSVMTFEYADCVFNLLDTPGHEDFSEDTYRTLTAVNSAVMVIDAAKGIEARTRKLFEVCRLRDIPIVTFINKMDREAAIRSNFSTKSRRLWRSTQRRSPGRSAAAALRRHVQFPPQDVRNLDKDAEQITVSGPDDQLVAGSCPSPTRGRRATNSSGGRRAEAFRLAAFREGHLTPVLFGSALRNFGVRDLIDAMAEWAPSPRGQAAASRIVRRRSRK